MEIFINQTSHQTVPSQENQPRRGGLIRPFDLEEAGQEECQRCETKLFDSGAGGCADGPHPSTRIKLHCLEVNSCHSETWGLCNVDSSPVAMCQTQTDKSETT